MDDEQTYRIVRYFFKGGKLVLHEGVTLEEAQEHCNDPETSSKTCSGNLANYTETNGPWFDGYERE